MAETHDRINWGLVGCGDIANKRVAPAIQTAGNSRLIACVRKEPRRLAEFQARHNIPKAYQDYADLLLDKEINAVYIATPVFLHCVQTIEAAEKGKHVLCEKPLAMNVAECRRMVDACRAHGVKLGVAYYRRFYPAVLKIQEILRQNLIGEPIFVRTTLVEHSELAVSAPTSWRFAPDHGGGGLLMDMASHRLDLLMMLFGQPDSVSAMIDTGKLRIAVEDTGTMLVRFANRVHAIVFATHCIQQSRDDFEVFGTQGSLRICPLNGEDLEVLTTEGRQVFHLPKADNVHLPLIEDFNEAIRQDLDPRVTGSEGMKASILLEAAYQSALTAQTVEFASQ